MRTILTLCFALALVLEAAAPVPRKADEIKVFDPSSGNTVLLSAQKGKVCVVQFLFTWCPHCQDTAKVLSKLQNEFGSKIQVLGVAFNDEVHTKDASRNNAEVIKFKQYANFPVGIESREFVLKYLGFSVMDRWGVPLMVIVDKKGNVVAQSKPSGSPELQREADLRALLTKLVNEK